MDFNFNADAEKMVEEAGKTLGFASTSETITYALHLLDLAQKAQQQFKKVSIVHGVSGDLEAIVEPGPKGGTKIYLVNGSTFDPAKKAG